MDAVNLAYVAGLIDGEGCIHMENSRTTFRPRLSVGMTEPALPLLQELHAEWGGTLYQQRQATERWAAAWTWHCGGPWAAVVLRAVQPYLRLKAGQADLAIETHAIWEGLQKGPTGQARWTPEARARCSEIKAQLHALNAKGPRATDAEVA